MSGGIDYMGPFKKSKNCEYILVAVDYVSKWVEAMPCRATDAKNSKKMFKETIFPRFEVPRMVINDGGTHFTINMIRTGLRCPNNCPIFHGAMASTSKISGYSQANCGRIYVLCMHPQTKLRSKIVSLVIQQ
jgi:hypothetical protein